MAGLAGHDGEGMADAKNKKGLISHGVAAQNRKARFDYRDRR